MDLLIINIHLGELELESESKASPCTIPIQAPESIQSNHRMHVAEAEVYC